MSDKLLGCPHCGEGRSIVACLMDDYGYWKVCCGSCGSSSGSLPDKIPNAIERIIAGWNTRHQSPVAAEGEALKHLGEILSMLAGLHADDQCDAYTEALAFYNAKRPNDQVQSEEGFSCRLVRVSPLDQVMEVHPAAQGE